MTFVVLTALIATIVFIVLFRQLRVVAVSRNAVEISRRSLGILRNPDLSDEEREPLLQKESIRLFICFLSILSRSAGCLLGPAAILGAAHWAGWAEVEAVVGFLSRWEVIVGLTLGLTACVWLRRRGSRPVKTAASNPYSWGEQALHKVAFSSPAVQLTAADMERSALGSAFRHVDPAPPIFITSLPRAGTTLLLEVLSRFDTHATHLYRDMPFVLAPVAWSRMSGLFRASSKGPVERAHGDGMTIDQDSPEAFEEVLWRTFWPDFYSGETLPLWTAEDRNEEAEQFFHEHMKKIIALRCPDETVSCHYLSKNNGNIARLPLLRSMFPAARILIPLRDPLEHAASLHRQHLRFQKMHSQDPFIRRYMEDIGHYEFGDLHKPIAFPGMEDVLQSHSPEEPDYWLAYWLHAFLYVLDCKQNLLFVSYEGLCSDPDNRFRQLAKVLDLRDDRALEEAASAFKPPSKARGGELDFSPELQARTREVWEELVARDVTT